jgi:membrane protein
MTEPRHPTTNHSAVKGAWRVGRLPAALLELWQLVVYVVARFNRNSGLSMASALAYTSLLATVPLFAIGLAMLAAFPALQAAREQLQAWVFRHFVPSVGTQVQDWVLSFVGNAGKLTAIGVVGLAFTAIMLLLTIESTLNMIFRVEHDRPLISRLFVYWTVLTLGPLLVGASFSLVGYVEMVERWASVEGFTAPAAWTRLVPPALVMMAFSMLYYVVPNRPVRIADAAAGGIVAGLLFATLRGVFAVYVGSSQSYDTLYGALAVIPIFLAWLYLSWVVILVGAEITAALPERRHGRLDKPGPLPASRRLALALDVLHILYQESRDGSRGIDRKHLLARTAAGEESLRSVLRLLTDARFLARFDDGRYMLSRDPGSATVYDLVRALDLRLAPDSAEVSTEEWHRCLHDRLAESDQAERDHLGITLQGLFSADADYIQRQL